MPDIAQGGTLGDFARLQRGTTYKSKLLGGDGPWLLGLACVARNGGFKSGNLKTYGGSSDPKILVAPGDLLVSLKDVTQAADLLGSVVKVPKFIGQGRLTQDTVKLVFEPDFSAHSYIYWLLRTPQARAHCRQHATGTTNLGLARDDFLAIEVPPLDKSRKYLLQVLQALDDKIELNRRMNETLEAQARALFRDWFVDFGPVKAKKAGDAPYFAPDLWSLFPSGLGDDGVPDGWERSELGKHVLNFDARRVPLSKAQRAKRQGEFPYHGATSVMDWVDSYLFDGVYTLVGEDGSVTNANGHAITQYVFGKFWVNNHAHVLQGKGPVSTEQILLFFKHEYVTPFVTGAVQLKLSQGRMNSMPFIFAGSEICDAFNKIVTPLFGRIRTNELESRTLAATRDLLLPRLFSGEIRIDQARKQLEDAL